MTAFLTALGSGISAKKILEYLMRKSPQLAPGITQALASGLSADKVLKFFSKDRNFEKVKESMQKEYSLENNANPLVQGENIRSKNLAPDMASTLQRNIGPALGTAAAAGTSYALSRAIPSILQSTGAFNPEAKATDSMQKTPEIPATNESSFNLPSNVVEGNITQNENAIQPEIKGINPEELLSKFSLTSHVDKIAKNVKDPSQIAAVLYSQFPGEMSKMQKEAGKPMEEVIGEYLQQPKKEALPTTNELVEPQQKAIEKKFTDALPEEKEERRIAKQDTVATPQGIGEVKEIRNGKAIVEVDGKKHQVDEEDLEEEPQEIIETVKNLLKIPEVDRSSVVSLFTYDPTDNEMYVQFHNGDTTKYLDVDPKKVFNIANKMGIPITEGKNIFGAWSPQDKNSLGAALIKEIINDPKYKKSKKGQPQNPNYRNLETLYDYWEKLRKKPKRKRL